MRGREVQIFRRRLFNDEPARLVDLATSFGVTRERVRQLEGRLKERLRIYLRQELKQELKDEVGIARVPMGAIPPGGPLPLDCSHAPLPA